MRIFYKNISEIDSFEYLEITLLKNGNWNRHKNTSQSTHCMHFIIYLLFTTPNQLSLSTKEKCHLFDSLVVSILNYGSKIYGYYMEKDIEITHIKFIRIMLYVRKNTNIAALENIP